MDFKLHVVPYDILGVKLFAVETDRGVVLKRCNTREVADSYVTRAKNGDTQWLRDELNACL